MIYIMLGELTTSEALHKELKRIENEMENDFPDMDFDYRNWLPVENPVPGVYIGKSGFMSCAFDQTKDLEQSFWWSFDESKYYKNKDGKLVKNRGYLGCCYGLCDNYEQALEYLKKYVACKGKTFVIYMYPIWQEKENAGKWGGFRPYKNGEYVGKYKEEIDSCEYFDDCEFPDDFPGYIYSFHAIRIK